MAILETKLFLQSPKYENVREGWGKGRRATQISFKKFKTGINGSLQIQISGQCRMRLSQISYCACTIRLCYLPANIPLSYVHTNPDILEVRWWICRYRAQSKVPLSQCEHSCQKS